jgi:uncharacterized protein
VKIVDANVLLYATNTSSQQHGAANKWLTSALNGNEASPRHPSILRDLLQASGSAGNLTSDAHIAALAIEHRADIVTFDRNFERFSVRIHIPQ